MVKWVGRIAVALVAGLVAQTLVAWAIAVWVNPPLDGMGTYAISHDDAPMWFSRHASRAGVRLIERIPVYQDDRVAGRIARRLSKAQPSVHPHAAEHVTQRPVPDQDRSVCHVIDERGWPALCMRSYHRYRPVRANDRFLDDVCVDHGIQVNPQRSIELGGFPGQRVRAIALEPIWPGVLINTTVFALIGTALWMAIRELPRVLRTRAAVFTTVVSLGGGVLATIVVAAGAAALPLNLAATQANSARKHDELSVISMQREDTAWASRLVWMRGAETFRRPLNFDRTLIADIAGLKPWWSDVPVQDLQQCCPFGYQLVVTGYGWPFCAMRNAFTVNMLNDSVTILEGVEYDRSTVAHPEAAQSFRVLPTGFIWIGFVANSLVYTSVLILILAILGGLRVRVRRLRCRCEMCGYDLRESTSGCPECGWQRAPVETG